MQEDAETARIRRRMRAIGDLTVDEVMGILLEELDGAHHLPHATLRNIADKCIQAYRNEET